MADKTQFLEGVLGADFMQQKTSDYIYLKDIVADIADSLEYYNTREMALTQLLAYKFDYTDSNSKLVYTDDSFTEIGELQTPGMRSGFDVWNVPAPIRRWGSLTKITQEKIKTMSSADLLSFHNGKIIADKKNLVKQMFSAMITSSPATVVDALDGKATEVKAFWNNDGTNVPRSNGQITFLNTHQHYSVVATTDTLVEADIDDSLIANIMEHENMGGAQIVLWARTGATLNLIRALTGFKAIVEQPLILTKNGSPYNASGVAQALVRSAQSLGWNVKCVGTYKEAIVMETPDLPLYYILATAYFAENDVNAPLGWREHPQFKGLMLVSPSGQNPIIGMDAQYRRYLGFHVRNRSAGAVLYTHNSTTYTDPTFA